MDEDFPDLGDSALTTTLDDVVSELQDINVRLKQVGRNTDALWWAVVVLGIIALVHFW